jgi:hypothetical protein
MIDAQVDDDAKALNFFFHLNKILIYVQVKFSLYFN